LTGFNMVDREDQIVCISHTKNRLKLHGQGCTMQKRNYKVFTILISCSRHFASEDAI
jgi:hypothetical protein